MKVSVDSDQGLLHFDLAEPLDISIPIQRNDSVSSFQIAGADYKDYEVDGFIGNMKRGGSCNLETISFTAHGNGSHTECYGHITTTGAKVNDHVTDTHYLSLVLSLSATETDEGLFLDFSEVDWQKVEQHQALIIRTLPNTDTKLHKDYSGSPTPCITPDDMQLIVDAGIDHLLVDLPSVDPEWDGGKLASHHVFWNVPESPRTKASITEFIFVDDKIEDGRYLLKLNISNFISDAAPSRPTLYPLVP